MFLCQSVFAETPGVEVSQQIDKEKRYTHVLAQAKRVLSHLSGETVSYRSSLIDSATYSNYQKLLTQEGPLTVIFTSEDNTLDAYFGRSGVQVTKTLNDGRSLLLLKAYADSFARFDALSFVVEDTPFAQLKPIGTKWQLSVDDGRRNKLTAYISSSGSLTVDSGNGKDTLEIRTPVSVMFTGDLMFSKINLKTSQAVNAGALKVDALSLKQFFDDSPGDSIGSLGSFVNAGYLQLTDLQINKCIFSNENKIVSQKQLNLNLENGEFVNNKVDTKTGVIETEVLNLTGTMGTFSNKSTLDVVSMLGTIHKLTNEGIINIKSSEKEAVHLVGQTLENRANWDATGGMDLQFQSIGNRGSVTAVSLMLQSDGFIQNYAGAKLYAKQVFIDGKCFLTNNGTVLSDHLLNLKVNSATNEGLLLAKDLLRIDNDGHYFKNTAAGIIQSEGILQIAATGRWWTNEGQIIAKEVQSAGNLLNIGPGVISSKLATVNGQLFNDATFKADELNGSMQSIGGAGKFLMTNGQVKIDGDYVQLGQWSCFGKCDLATASSFYIFGDVKGGAENGQPVQLTIASGGKLWHGGNLDCGQGALCTTISTQDTVNAPSSKTTSNGVVEQQSSGGDVRLAGPVNGKGSYSASAPAGTVSNLGTIDIGGNVEFKGKNIQQDGKVNSGGKFSGDAEKVFTNNGEINSEKGFDARAGQKFENSKDATIANREGEVRIESPEVINKGKILSKEDLKIFASKIFLNEGGTVKIGGDAAINAGAVDNVAGRILVAHLLTIHAKKLENKRAPTIMKPGEDCPQPPLWESRGTWFGGFWGHGSFGTRTCQGEYEVETSDGAVISSMGNMVLDVGDGTNLGSTIYAKGDITITGDQFRNLAHNLKNYKVTKSWRHWETCEWFGLSCEDHYEPITTVRNEPDYVGATLGADGKILINKSSFENTGNVKSENFNLVGKGDESTKFINGLFDSFTLTAKKPEPKSGDMEVYPYLDQLGNLFYFRVAAADEKDPNGDKKVQYILIPTDAADQKTLNQQVGSVTRGLSERPQIAYLQTGSEESPPSHLFVMQQQLAAQVVESMLITELGTSHLSGFENKTAVEQYNVLEARGFQYAQQFAGKQNESSSQDELPLKLEQINNAKETFIYYELVKHGSKTGYAPVLHLGTEEAKKQVPGTDGTIKARSIRIAAGDVKNSGTLESSGDFKITARTFENQRRDYKEIEIVKEQDGFWGGTRTRVFEIRTPQIGGNIIGVNVEIVADGNVVNSGGMIEGKQHVYLVSNHGNVEHKAFIGSHVVHIHQTSWGVSHGRSTAEEALDYYPAVVISGGNVGITAETKEVLIKASAIIGTGRVNISGYKGVVIEAEMSKHTTADTRTMFSGNHEEAVVVQRSTITSAKGDVVIESKGGPIYISAATLAAFNGAVYLEAKDRITLGTQSIQYTNSKTEAAGGLSIGSTTTEMTQTAVEQTVISALKGIFTKAGEDNVFEAVLMHSGGYIHIVAGRDNIFKGFEKNTDIKTSGWNIGVSFPGSEAIEALMKGNKGDVIKSLRDGDPLLSAINRLRQAQDAADKIGEGTYVAIEALRALDQYLNESSQPGTTSVGMLGQRLGLTDANGNFAPKITLHVGTFKSETQMTEVLRTALDAQGEVKITSERDTHLLDGMSINADRILITAKDITTSPAQNRVHSETDSSSASISYGADGASGGASHSESHRDTVTNQNVQLNAKTVEVKCDNLKGTGLEINAEDVAVDVKKVFILESVQDTDVGSSTSFSFQAGGSSSSTSFSQESIDKARVNKPAGINASKSLKIRVGDTLYLIGGVLNGPKDATSISADKLKATHIKDRDDTSSFGGSFQFTVGKDAKTCPVPAVFDFDHKEKTYVGATQSTISKDAYIEVKKITDDLQKINRELDKVQIGSSDTTHLRAVIPMLNLEQIQKDMQRINELLGGDSKLDEPIEFSLLPDEIEDEGTAEEKTQTDKSKSKVKEVRVVSTQSVATTNYEGDVSTLELVGDDGASLGKVQVGDFKEPGRAQVQDVGTSISQNYSTALFADKNGQQALLIKSDDGHKYVVQGNKETLQLIKEWREVIADLGENVISLVPIWGPPAGAGFNQLVNGKIDPIKNLEGVSWGIADIYLVGWAQKIHSIGKIAAASPKAVKLITKTKQVITEALRRDGHHSFPKFLGGNPVQKLVKMTKSQHIEFHQDLLKFLKSKYPEMVTKRGYPGVKMHKMVPEQTRIQALKEFYSGPGAKYAESAAEFFKQIQ